MKETYDQRRRFLIPRLRELGFGITVEPTGAFYILANAKRFSQDSYRIGLRYPERGKGWSSTRHRFRDECRRIPSFFIRQLHGEYRGRNEPAGKVSGTLSKRGAPFLTIQIRTSRVFVGAASSPTRLAGEVACPTTLGIPVVKT